MIEQTLPGWPRSKAGVRGANARGFSTIVSPLRFLLLARVSKWRVTALQGIVVFTQYFLLRNVSKFNTHMISKIPNWNLSSCSCIQDALFIFKCNQDSWAIEHVSENNTVYFVILELSPFLLQLVHSRELPSNLDFPHTYDQHCPAIIELMMIIAVLTRKPSSDFSSAIALLPQALTL